MADVAHKRTDKMIKRLEREIKRDYARANRECKQKFKDYMAQFEKKDELMIKKLKAGEITKKEYSAWRVNQMATGQRWKDMCDVLVKDYTNADMIARSIVKGHMAEAYALNRNYGMYQVEAQARISTSFTLYDGHTVERLWLKNPKLLPNPSLSVPIAERWNRQHIVSSLTQGILQGESIPKVADRLNDVTGMGYRSSVRAARTSMTAAQNAGRVDSYKDAEDMGIEMQQMWLATLDDRTRHSHVMMDGETVPVGETFSNGCRYPADPDCDEPSEVYNCRCTLISQIKGFEHDPSDLSWRNSEKLNGLGYDEWKRQKRSKAKK